MHECFSIKRADEGYFLDVIAARLLFTGRTVVAVRTAITVLRKVISISVKFIFTLIRLDNRYASILHLLVMPGWLLYAERRSGKYTILFFSRRKMGDYATMMMRCARGRRLRCGVIRAMLIAYMHKATDELLLR